jgi:hypothetical protein
VVHGAPAVAEAEQEADAPEYPGVGQEEDEPLLDDEAQATLETQMDQQFGPRTSGHNLRPREERSYSSRSSYPGSHGNVHTTINGASVATSEMSMKKGSWYSAMTEMTRCDLKCNNFTINLSCVHDVLSTSAENKNTPL